MGIVGQNSVSAFNPTSSGDGQTAGGQTAGGQTAGGQTAGGQTGTVHKKLIARPLGMFTINFGAKEMASQNPITPKALTVRSGTSVTWLNKDNSAHRITSGTLESGPTNIFSSDNFESGENYTIRTSAPGVYKFYDPISSNINGTLTVIGKTLGKAIESTTRGIGGGQPVGGQTGGGQPVGGQPVGGQTGGGQTGGGQTGEVQLPPGLSKFQIPSDIKCSSKEQYDLKSQTCEEVGKAGIDVFKIIVKKGEHIANNAGKLQVWATGNDITKVREVSQSLLSDPSGVVFEFQPDVIKVDDSFTVCYQPLKTDSKDSEPICTKGSNSPDKKPETVTLDAK